MTLVFDTSDFDRKKKIFEDRTVGRTEQAINDVSSEILRLSQKEVPHDTGALQNSGGIEAVNRYEAIVGYNKVYAARLHENPQFRFQKGRKGKYLEDPIKSNLKLFREQITNSLFS